MTIATGIPTGEFVMLIRKCLAGLVLVLGVAEQAAADIISLDLAAVGDPGNSADTAHGTGWGAVSSTYWIGKFEITARQYTAFLNAVATTDKYGLYNQIMADTSYGIPGDPPRSSLGCNIIREGSEGTYTYSVASDWADRPVNHVTFWSAARFANWLHNGQKTGAQDSTTTEDGAYTLLGYREGDGQGIVRNPGARWFLPSTDEWYKAAYYKGGGTAAGYWDYPTRSDIQPTTEEATIVGSLGPPYWRSPVGFYTNSSSPYGTYDQGGNVSEWTETIASGSYRMNLGGHFPDGAYALQAEIQPKFVFDSPAGHWNYVGFRVASAVDPVPEPSTLVLFSGLGAMGLIAAWRRRKRTA